MKPSDKSQTFNELLDSVAETHFGISRTDAITEDICVFCKSQVEENDFEDEISKKEYTISGLCQSCQNDVFSDPEEDEYWDDYSDWLDDRGSY